MLWIEVHLENEEEYETLEKESLSEYTDDYKYELLVYDLLNVIDLDEKQYKRLNEELRLIRLSKSFSSIYISYLLTSKIRKDGKNYLLFCDNNNLLINYLLGISKVNPLDTQFLYDLPYEPVLGILEEPKKLMIQIWVSPDYHQTLVEYLKSIINEDYNLLNRLNVYKNKVDVSDSSFILISKKEELTTYGDYYDNGTIRGFKEVYKDNNLDLIRISLLKSERIKILDEGSKYLDDYNPSEAFELLLDECLAGKNDRFVNAKGEPYNYYGLTFWDFCLSVCESRNITENRIGNILLKCREDVWKMLERCDLNNKERYIYYKNINKHIGSIDDKLSETIRKTYPFDSELIIGNILNFYYIYPIGASIEDLYKEAKIAWIRKKFKKQVFK